jgi:hypothetical protein
MSAAGNLQRGVFLALALCLSAVVAACKGPADPPDPGLLGEDFGAGVKLLSSADEAHAAEGSGKAGVLVDALTTDELLQAAPYDGLGKQDQVLAVVAPPPAGVTANAPAVVTELRCYVAQSEESSVTLLKRQLSGMSIEQAQEILGSKGTLTESGAATHVEFRFADKSHPQLKLALMLSFRDFPGGRSCYAARLHFITPPPKF